MSMAASSFDWCYDLFKLLTAIWFVNWPKPISCLPKLNSNCKPKLKTKLWGAFSLCLVFFSLQFSSFSHQPCHELSNGAGWGEEEEAGGTPVIRLVLFLFTHPWTIRFFCLLAIDFSLFVSIILRPLSKENLIFFEFFWIVKSYFRYDKSFGIWQLLIPQMGRLC